MAQDVKWMRRMRRYAVPILILYVTAIIVALLFRENVAHPHHGVSLYDHRRDGLSRDAYHVANDKTSESSSNAYIPIRIRMGGCNFVDGAHGDASDSGRFWSRDRSLFWDMGSTQSDSAKVVHEAT